VTFAQERIEARPPSVARDVVPDEGEHLRTGIERRAHKPGIERLVDEGEARLRVAEDEVDIVRA